MLRNDRDKKGKKGNRKRAEKERKKEKVDLNSPHYLDREMRAYKNKGF